MAHKITTQSLACMVYVICNHIHNLGHKSWTKTDLHRCLTAQYPYVSISYSRVSRIVDNLVLDNIVTAKSRRYAMPMMYSNPAILNEVMADATIGEL